MLELAIFVLLFALLLVSPAERRQLQAKKPFEWFLDGSNLLIQGTLIPFLRLALWVAALKLWLPQWQGAWALSAWPVPLTWSLGFALNFVLVDYLYYWNHRILHHKKLFPIHIVHHSVTHMDVMATSRNTLWTSFLIVYLWVNGLLLYLLNFNPGFVLAMSLTAALDIWKHSSALHQHPDWQVRLSRWGVMTPMNHAWHHSARLNCNYGANWNWFDRLHGSYYAAHEYPERLGVKTGLSPWQQLLFPFRSTERKPAHRSSS